MKEYADLRFLRIKKGNSGMDPMVSIIIPVFNGSDYMQEAIDSALSQKYSNYEVIVVNDGSNDGGKTRNIALSYGNKVRYYEKENGGVSSALNLGITKMKGEYFAWLSHDDVYSKDRIRSHIDRILSSDNKRNVAYSKRCNWYYENQGLEKVNSIEYPTEFYESGLMAIALGLIDGCSITIHKDWFAEYGLFDEKLRTVQDYTKWYEMFHDKRLLYIDSPLSKTRVHSNQQGARISKQYFDESCLLYSNIIEKASANDLNIANISLYEFLGIISLRLKNNGFDSASEEALKKLRNCEEPRNSGARRRSFKSYISKSGKPLYLYCMGKRGKSLLQGLYLRGITVDGFSDREKRNWNMKMYDAMGVEMNDIPLDSTIIVTKDNPEDVTEMLMKKGYKSVIPYDSIMKHIIDAPIDKTKVVL